MTESTRLVVFDCDGTLADSEASILASLKYAFAAEELAVPDEARMRAHIGLSMDHFISGVFGGAADPDLALRLKQHYREEFQRRRIDQGPDPLFPGLRDLLHELASAGVLLAVATGKSRRGLRTWIDGHGLGPLFVSLQTADDAPSKPHPGMILQAMAEAGVSPERTVMVGDTTFDVQAAVAANVRAVGVAWGHHTPAQLLDAGASAVVDTTPELRDVLAR